MSNRNERDGLEKRIDLLEERVEILGNQIKALSHQIETQARENNKRFQALENRIDALENKVEALENKVEALDNKVEALDNKVNALNDKVDVLDNKVDALDNKLNALGARWGLQSENSFRNAMAGILHDIGFTVEKYRKFDAEGKVHGSACDVEIDVIVFDGMTVLIEIKSSLDHWDVYTFNRIAEFYERQENKKADRKALISPFVTERVESVAAGLGIQIYTDIRTQAIRDNLVD